MTFTELALPGVWAIDDDVFTDERGAFACLWASEALAARGLDSSLTQCNWSTNDRKGTIRGLHYQAPPFAQVKIVRAIRGAVFDVAVDLRPDSPTFMRWIGMELSERSARALYLPRGVAHGYQALTNDAAVLYFVSTGYAPDHQRGVRWNDPAFAIAWPLGAPTVINARDAAFADFTPDSPATAR
ncbi:MAG TPA: dTDP-4-dehydrorhamnose 3,5-epimerase [Vicinamibacterales bacterium]|nr:dTDP-4-dehydrorhamnose 3,5-epimerase [Vicinamibacterales bacterium]